MKKYLLFLVICYIGHVNGQIITTIAGNGTAGYSGDGGQATLAKLNYPSGIAFDTFGNLYISESHNNCIRKVSVTGIITTIAGNGTAGYTGDGGQAISATLFGPNGVAVDQFGNIYIADYAYNIIRKVNAAGVINTIAGNGNMGFAGDGGQATSAEFFDVEIALDNLGNLYISDGGNNRIRYVNNLGIINTIAGNGLPGFSGNGGQATSAELNYPAETVIDRYGNLFIADYSNNLIRKVNTSGIITIVAGNGSAGFSGDGGQATLAQLSAPTSLAVDTLGNLYISDTYNYRVRKVNTFGIITTIAGNGTNGYSGDGGLATTAEISRPYRITLDTIGNIYIADLDNNRVRKVSVSHSVDVNKYSSSNMQMSVYPNPTRDQFIIESNTLEKLNIELYDTNGKQVFRTNGVGKTNIDVSTLNEGVYNLAIKTVENVLNKKLVIIR